MKERKLHIRIILKSGAEFTIKCDEFSITRDGFGNPKNYDIKGIAENKPIYLDFSQVAAIVRLVSNEMEGECS